MRILLRFDHAKPWIFEREQKWSQDPLLCPFLILAMLALNHTLGLLTSISRNLYHLNKHFIHRASQGSEHHDVSTTGELEDIERESLLNSDYDGVSSRALSSTSNHLIANLRLTKIRLCDANVSINKLLVKIND